MGSPGVPVTPLIATGSLNWDFHSDSYTLFVKNTFSNTLVGDCFLDLKKLIDELKLQPGQTSKELNLDLTNLGPNMDGAVLICTLVFNCRKKNKAAVRDQSTEYSSAVDAIGGAERNIPPRLMRLAGPPNPPTLSYVLPTDPIIYAGGKAGVGDRYSQVEEEERAGHEQGAAVLRGVAVITSTMLYL
eukprot:1177964-Prorocentrum_minimum.AAC.1